MIKEFFSHHTSAVESLKLAPPIGILSVEALGAKLQPLILIGTAIYTVLLILHKLFQMWKDWHKYRNKLPDSTMSGEP